MRHFALRHAAAVYAMDPKQYRALSGPKAITAILDELDRLEQLVDSFVSAQTKGEVAAELLALKEKFRNVEVDDDVDAVYVTRRRDTRVVKTVQIPTNSFGIANLMLNVDVDFDDRVVGVEIL